MEYSSGFTYEIFRDHVTNIMNNSREFKNIAVKDPFEGWFENGCRLIRENRIFESPTFQKKILLQMAVKVADSSAGIDKNEEKAIAVIMGILDGII